MGFFDSWKNEPDPEPVAAPSPAPHPVPQAPASAATPVTQSGPITVAKKAAPTAKPTTPTPPPKDKMPEFGIQKTIELMRQLPPDNVELVVSVVKTTLESMNVDVTSIIGDAQAKQDKITTRVAGLRDEIAELREEIAGREEEITALESDFAETKMVRERLELAQKAVISGALGASAKPPVRPAAPRPAAAPAPNTAKHPAVSVAPPKKASGDLG
jgi:hypothetical protein